MPGTQAYPASDVDSQGNGNGVEMRNKKIAIVTDSSAYIPDSALTGLDVSVIPLWLLWEGESFRDGVDVDPTTFYKKLREAKSLPTSSQPTVMEFEDFFKEVLTRFDAIVNVLVSSKISGTIDNAQQAIAKMPESDIRLVDTLSSSMGLGLSVLAAARAAAAGKSIDGVVAGAGGTKGGGEILFFGWNFGNLHQRGGNGGA